MEISIFDSSDEVSHRAASFLSEHINKTISDKGIFNLVLSGGKTPEQMYDLMAEKSIADSINWKKVEFFWGDERCVGPEEEASNFKTVRDRLISKIEIPEKNIHRIKGELFEKALKEYENEIEEVFNLEAGELPVFDLVILGMGEDGHTASLFPNTEALNVEGKIVTYVEKAEDSRITMTKSTINRAKNILIMVTGPKKARVLAEALEGEYRPYQYPIQFVRKSEGKVTWYIDRFSSAKLSAPKVKTVLTNR